MDNMEDYPGLNFTPPKDTVDPDDTEGEALVAWKKVGDSYTIVSFEGKPLEPESEDEGESPEPPDSMMELDRIYKRPPQ